MVDCNGCESSCCRIVIFWLDNKDHADWAKHHGISVLYSKKLDKYAAKLDIECQELSDNKCKIYKDRPKMCREYDCNKQTDDLKIC